MSSGKAKIVLKDLYETRFGLYNHSAPDRNPLSSILMNPGEEYLIDSPIRDLIEEFAVYNYGELWNISLIEFINLPRPYVELIRKIKDGVMKKRQAIVENVERGLVGKK